MATVDDLLDTLQGPITQQLHEREGRRLSVSKPDVKRATVGPKPEDNRAVDAGTPGSRAMNAGDLNDRERKQRDSGGHIADLDD